LRPRDVAELVALAALWGGSFLFMRIAVPAFGPFALAALRVAGASLLLLPLLVARGELGALRRHWRPIAVVGLTNSALPFACFAYAALTIDAGVSAIFNAATPLFSAVIAWLWLADRMTLPRIVGLAVGFAGVVWVAWDRSSAAAATTTHVAPAAVEATHVAGAAVLACILGALFYGMAPSITKHHLTGVPPLAVAAGSQLAATLLLALPAAAAWPAASPAPAAWAAAAALAFVCTGLAYILYFRLIAHAGPANAVAVTYLVPIFAVLWGGLFLGERVTVSLALGCAVIFVGTALATGVIGTRRAPLLAAGPDTPPRR
jgi:drug/metabolite transporter (DMT)-like permease